MKIKDLGNISIHSRNLKISLLLVWFVCQNEDLLQFPWLKQFLIDDLKELSFVILNTRTGYNIPAAILQWADREVLWCLLVFICPFIHSCHNINTPANACIRSNCLLHCVRWCFHLFFGPWWLLSFI